MSTCSKLLDFFSSWIACPEEDVMQETSALDSSNWKKFFGKNVANIGVPPKVTKLLDTPCPFWPNKLVKETHILCLVPKGLNQSTLYELAGKKGNFDDTDTGVQKPYWVLVTKKIVPELKYFSSEKQQSKLQSFQVARQSYDVPSKIEAIVATLAAKHLGGYSIFPDRENATKCKETDVVIGSDSGSSFCGYANNWDKFIGVAGVIRFPETEDEIKA